MSDTALRTPVQHLSTSPQEWQRHTPAQRLLRFAIWIVLVAAVVQSIRHVQVIPEFLLDAPQQMGDLLGRMWPPAFGYYPSGVHAALMETLHIASLGTLVSLVFAVPLGLLVASNLTRSRGLNFLARVVLVSSRSVNSLVWALLFVAVFGPGALAGSLAIGFRSIGFVGKLLGEAIEQAPSGPIEALQAAGAGWFARIWYGFWPHIKPAFWSIVLLRWDINVRESAVLGLVGAGGIGMVLDTAMNLFQWDRVAMVLLSVFAVVVVAELIVTRVRQQVL
jgi:phosphonate transport system permease protein